MTLIELENLLEHVGQLRAEGQTLELKSAAQGCPTRLYDTLSSFSNQDDGGTILFGVDEQHNFVQAGVYDAQDLMKHVAEQCQQMEPPVRPVFTTLLKDGKAFVSAEIPGLFPPALYHGGLCPWGGDRGDGPRGGAFFRQPAH